MSVCLSACPNAEPVIPKLAIQAPMIPLCSSLSSRASPSPRTLLCPCASCSPQCLPTKSGYNQCSGCRANLLWSGRITDLFLAYETSLCIINSAKHAIIVKGFMKHWLFDGQACWLWPIVDINSYFASSFRRQASLSLSADCSYLLHFPFYHCNVIARLYGKSVCTCSRTPPCPLSWGSSRILQCLCVNILNTFLCEQSALSHVTVPVSIARIDASEEFIWLFSSSPSK